MFSLFKLNFRLILSVWPPNLSNKTTRKKLKRHDQRASQLQENNIELQKANDLLTKEIEGDGRGQKQHSQGKTNTEATIEELKRIFTTDKVVLE